MYILWFYVILENIIRKIGASISAHKNLASKISYQKSGTFIPRINREPQVMIKFTKLSFVKFQQLRMITFKMLLMLQNLFYEFLH